MATGSGDVAGTASRREERRGIARVSVSTVQVLQQGQPITQHIGND
jgi:hypothetical protein